jgi:hypothetical protein
VTLLSSLLTLTEDFGLSLYRGRTLLVKLKKDIMALHAKKEADARSNQKSFSES